MDTSKQDPKADYVLSAKIAKVSFIDETKAQFDNSEKRIFLTLSESFLSYDKDGNAITTNRLSIDAFALCEQIVIANSESTLAGMLTQTFGKALKPNLLASCVQGAQLTAKRIFHAKDSLRSDGKSVYAHDCFTTQITIFEENISKIANLVINKAIENESFAVEEQDAEKQAKKELTLSQKWQW